METNYKLNLINKGDTVFLGHGGEVCQFTVHSVLGDKVRLMWAVENVVHLKWVDKAKLLAQLQAQG